MSQFEQDALLVFEDAFAGDPATRDQAQHCARLALAALIEAFGGLSPYIPATAKYDFQARIEAGLQQGRSIRSIATELGVSHTTVYRRLQHTQREL